MFKKFLILLVLISSITYADIFFVDPVKSILSFEVNQLKFDTVKGVMESYTIVMDYDESLQQVNRLESKIDVNSLGTGNAIRDRYLRSDIFFDILEYPDILAVINEPFFIYDKTVSVNFQIKNNEKQLLINFDHETVNENDVEYLVVDSNFQLDRHDFNVSGYRFIVDNDVKVNMKLFFRKNNE